MTNFSPLICRSRALLWRGHHRTVARPFRSARSSGSAAEPAFTLVELLVVIGLIGLLMALMVPALKRMGQAGAAKAYFDIAGLLELARTHAMANQTYVFVGFAETDVSQPESGAQKAGVGRVYAAAVASRDGTPGFSITDPARTWEAAYNKGSSLVAVTKLLKFDNIHMTDLLPTATQGPFKERPVFNYAQIGTTAVKTPFVWPLGNPLGATAAGTVNFDKGVMFDPTGAARMSGAGDKIPQYLELCLQETRGNVDPGMPADASVGNHAAISINGLTGAVQVFRP